jgi:hypothetical protein
MSLGTTGRVQAPQAPPTPPAFVSISRACILLDVSRRRFGELRAADPTFPAGRLFGGRGALRFNVAALLRWAEQQPEARFSTRGGPRPGGRFERKDEAGVGDHA